MRNCRQASERSASIRRWESIERLLTPVLTRKNNTLRMTIGLLTGLFRHNVNNVWPNRWTENPARGALILESNRYGSIDSSITIKSPLKSNGQYDCTTQRDPRSGRHGGTRGRKEKGVSKDHDSSQKYPKRRPAAQCFCNFSTAFEWPCTCIHTGWTLDTAACRCYLDHSSAPQWPDYADRYAIYVKISL